MGLALAPDQARMAYPTTGARGPRALCSTLRAGKSCMGMIQLFGNRNYYVSIQNITSTKIISSLIVG